MSVGAVDVIDLVVHARRAELVELDAARPCAHDVAGVIESIYLAYSSEWERQKAGLAREYLSRTLAGIPVPALSVCGRGTQEIRYSAYLAYFLDRTKQHGLGNRYLEAVLASIERQDICTDGSVVETEVWLGDVRGRTRSVGCYCDIVVKCGRHVVFIENKVKSAESGHPDSDDSQLKRYNAAISENPTYAGLSQVRVFLTPSGRESAASPYWHGMSYGDLVAAGIRVLRAGGISTTGRENLKRFLIDLSLGPFDRAESEIKELTELATRAVAASDFRTRVRFDQLVSRNRALVELLLEG